MNRDFKGVMRPGQNKRSRNRNGMNGGGGGGGNPNPNLNNPNNNRPRPPHRIQTFESSGPSVKIRGNAYQVFERYVALAREAATSGDRIAAENYYQHAEHYFRVMNANGDGHGNQQASRPMTPADTDMGMDPEFDNEQPEQPNDAAAQPQPQPPEPEPEPGFQPN
jgi:hypothetical protein